MRRVALEGRFVDFLPVAYVNRRQRRWIPDSLMLCMGICKHLSQLREFHITEIQVHRLEIGVLSYLLFTKAYIVQCVHNNFEQYSLKTSESFWRFLKPLYFWLERVFAPKFDKILVFNKRASMRLINYNPQSTYLTTWYDPQFFFSSMTSPTLKPCFLFVGRMESQKNPQLFLEVAKLLDQDLEGGLEVRLIGIGSLLEKCKEMVHKLDLDAVTNFMGTVGRSELGEIMRNSSVMIMTSNFEGSPRVLYEAGACGLPIVGTSGSDPDGWLDGQNGFISTTDTARDLADKAISALKIDRLYCSSKARSKDAQYLVNLNF